LIEEPDGTRTTLEGDEMVEAIISRNIEHFSQAEGTPFTTEPLRSLLGQNATTPFAQQLLECNANINDLDISAASKAILRKLNSTTPLRKIAETVTVGEIIDGYKKWSEATTTSPSGLHLGHSKAMLKLQNTQEREAKESDSIPLYKRFFLLKTTIINSCIQLNYVCQRWKKVVVVLIEKIPGTPLINKFRVIHIMENDYNMLYGIILGRNMLWNAEDNNYLNDGQGGSRPGRRAQEQVLIKHCAYSIFRMSQSNGATFDNDAKSCFDRIVMTMASLCVQKLGATEKTCNLLLDTLNQIKYHIKTSNGISEESYESSWERSMHGPGQGGRASPAIWVAVSSLLMQCMEDKAIGATLRSPYSTELKKLWITGFVDDITHWVMKHEPSTEEDICRELQEAAQWWEQLLHSSGGKLELSKCFFYIFFWKFNDEGEPYLKNANEFCEQINIIDSESGRQIHIPQRDCAKEHKTLGIMESPDGKNDAEFKRLAKLSNTHGQRVATGQLSRLEAKIYYNTTFIPSMSYGFAAGTMSKGQCDKIHGQTISAFLSAMGFNRSSPREVVFGPPAIGGYGLQHLYDKQGTEKVSMILRLLRTKRSSAKILSLQLQWAQLLSGKSVSILEDTSTDIPQLHNERWITSLREFLKASEISIHIEELRQNKLQCVGDKYLMDTIESNWTQKDIIKINRCRIYLKATTLSDVCDPSGVKISTEASECSPEAIIETTDMWPNQPRPGPAHILIWKKFLKSFCDVDSFKLEEPLGMWTTQSIRCPIGINHFTSKSSELIRRKDRIWTSQKTISKRRYCTTTGEEININIQDITTKIPASIRTGRDTQVTWRQRLEVTRIHSPIKDWEDHVSKLPTWKRELLFHCSVVGSGTEIREELEREPHSISICHTGSASTTATSGVFGWVVSSGFKVLAYGRGGVPGSPITTYRSQSFGKLAALVFINEIKSYYKIKLIAAVTCYCDNKMVHTNTNPKYHYQDLKHSLAPSFDVLREIYIQQQHLRTSIYNILLSMGKNPVESASSHDHKTLLELTEQISEAAKNSDKMRVGSGNQYLLPNGGAHLIINGKHIWSDEILSLRWRRAEFELQHYYMKKFNMDVQMLHSINWAGLKLARNSLPPNILHFSLKYSIDWLPTGTLMEKCGQLVTECALCGCRESGQHLLRCIGREKQITTLLQKFETFLGELKTEEKITKYMVNALTNWISMSNHHQVLTPDEIEESEISEAVWAQESVGWHLFVRGIIVKEWSSLQEKHLEQNNVKSLGDQWSAKISRWWIVHSHEIWMERNHTIHGEAPGKTNQHDEEVLEQVRLLYERKDELPANAHALLDLPIETRLQQPIETLTIWVRNTIPTVHACSNAFQAWLRQSNRSMTEYFQLSRRNIEQQQQQQQQHRESPNLRGTNASTTDQPDNLETLDNNSENIDPQTSQNNQSIRPFLARR
jgi:Reverse transcriptase (RNA-dependent DNA polymerase)